MLEDQIIMQTEAGEIYQKEKKKRKSKNLYWWMT